MDAISLSVAVSAGGLAVLNPCSFPLLPVFLSASVADDGRPRPGGSFVRGVTVGVAVSSGYVAVFAALALPISYGARFVTDLIPWSELVLGAVLVAAGALTLSGRQPALPVVGATWRGHGRLGAALVYGGGYGLASCGCALPLFLSLIGASLGTGSALVVLAAYAVGVTVVLMAFALAAAFLHDELSRLAKRLLPHVRLLSGLLLLVVGAYLTYFWWRTQYGSSATLADDPIVGRITLYTARLQTIAERHDTALTLGAAGVVTLVAAAALLARLRRAER